jgi:ADP-ribose pyrophosphatase
VHDAVLAGRLNNPGLVVGVLAAHAARARGWTTLRPADAPWPEHGRQRQ